MNDILQIVGSVATILGGITAIIQLYFWYIEYLKSVNAGVVNKIEKFNVSLQKNDVTPGYFRCVIKKLLVPAADSWVKGGGALGLLIGGGGGSYLGSEISQQIFGDEIDLIRIVGIVLAGLAGLVIGSFFGAILFRILPVVFKVLLIMAAMYLLYYFL